MEKHLTLVAAFHIGFSALGLLFSIIGFFIFSVFINLNHFIQDPFTLKLVVTIVPIIIGFALAFFATGIVGSIGLLKRWSWARILILVYSVIYLIKIPLGTALGIYSLWVLFQEETIKLFKKT